MASAFNKSNNGVVKPELDDTQTLSCAFLATETEDDHVVYIMRVQRGLDAKYSWQIKKRYNEFNDLHALLKVTGFELPMPPKKMFGNMKKEFLSGRQSGLQEFMEKVLGNLVLASAWATKRFLDQENYAGNYKEVALAHVSMFVRSDASWQVVEPLNEIGWRFRKQYIFIRNPAESNNKYILTWVCFLFIYLREIVLRIQKMSRIV